VQAFQMSSRQSKIEKEREKATQDRLQAMLSGMLKDEDNKYCVDCDNKGPRWASWNLGLFLCIRCAGIHRNLGVHISKVKSVNLDSWTPQQVASMQQMQNSKARAVYEAGIPEDFRRPQTDSAVEAFVRQKYEKKKFIQPNWQPSKPPDFPIGFEQGDESAINLSKAKVEVAKKVVLPARSPTAPATSRPAVAKTEPPRPVTAPSPSSSVPASTSASADLLGLMGSTATVPTMVKPHQATATIPSSASSDLLGLQAEFGDFTSASTPAPVAANNSSSSSDLFGAMSQPTPAASADPGKMSTDSIMALFGPSSSSSASASTAPRFPTQAPQASYQTPTQPSFGLGQVSFPAAGQHLPNLQGFGAPPQVAAANNPFLADAGLIQPTAGLGGQLAGLNLNQGQAPSLWQ